MVDRFNYPPGTYGDYRYWCITNGLRPVSRTTFVSRIESNFDSFDFWALSRLETTSDSPGKRLRTNATDLFRAYRAYCEGFGFKPMSTTAFGKRMASEYERSRVKGIVYYGAIIRGPSTLGVSLVQPKPLPQASGGVVFMYALNNPMTPASEPLAVGLRVAHQDELLTPSNAREALLKCLATNATLVGHDIGHLLASLVISDAELSEAVQAAYEDGRVYDTLLREKLRQYETTKALPAGWSLEEMAELYPATLPPWTEQERAALDGFLGTLPEDHDVDLWSPPRRRLMLRALQDVEDLWAQQKVNEVPSSVSVHERAEYVLALAYRHGLQVDIEHAQAQAEALTTAVEDITATDLSSEQDEGMTSLMHRQSSFRSLLDQVEVGRIHPRYDGYKATGRTSTSVPNIQGFAREGGLRESIVPTEGRVFIAADYATFELRALAQLQLTLLGQSKLADLIRQGTDVHLALAAELMEVSYAEAERLQGTHEVQRYRKLAKAANFGFPGGLGNKSFADYAAKQFGITLDGDRAKVIRDAWLTQFPEMKAFFAKAQAIIDTDKLVEIPLSGRKRLVETFPQACNTLFQGLAADAAKAAMWHIHIACRDPASGLFGARIAVFLHDEFIVEVDEDRISPAAKTLEAAMIAGAHEFIPDIPIVVEMAAMKRWSSHAQPRFDNDELVLWIPDAE